MPREPTNVALISLRLPLWEKDELVRLADLDGIEPAVLARMIVSGYLAWRSQHDARKD